ncbi:MAG TPA: N-acetyltransferase [Leeuwenhoekiella sp.]|nr:N-acetyltransferase [Leeuwenhoekiella sp.]
MVTPILSTSRLTLQRIAESDLKNIHELHSLPETDQYNTLGIPKNIDETKTIVESWVAGNSDNKQTHFTFKVELNSSRQFIGLIAINLGKPKFKNAEIWYKFHSDFWGKGYATEAVNKILDFGFNELHLHRIGAGCAVNNLGSIKVLEKVGMTREGQKRQVLPLKGGWSDNFEYAILDTDRN